MSVVVVKKLPFYILNRRPYAIDHMTKAITTSNICHAREFWNTGDRNRAPYPNEKKKTKLALMAPVPKTQGSADCAAKDPTKTTVSR